MSSDTSLREGGSDVGARRNVRPQRTKRKVDYSYSDYEATMKESIIPDLYRPPRKRKRGNDNSPYWHPIEGPSVNEVRQKPPILKQDKPLKEEIHTSPQQELDASESLCSTIRSDHIVPSIEIDPTSCINVLSDDDCDQTSIFVHEGVLVGFWSLDATGKGRRPVYCLIDKEFEFAYLKDGVFTLVRWIDFDPLDILGSWMGDDTEYDGDTEVMSPKEIREWVITMWYSRNFCGIETLGN